MLMRLLPRFRVYALALTNNPDEAEDLVQELVVRVLGAQEQFLQGTNFRAWCYAILRNQFIDTRRFAARHRLAPPSRNAVSALAGDGTQELGFYTHEVIEMISHLPVKLRRALVGYTSGMSYSEVARDFGVRIGTVRSRVSRARAAVRAAVCEADDGPILMCETPSCTWNVRLPGAHDREAIRQSV
jgi:RNA polymerase sigma-70 factor (ECF subfamily)